VYKQGKDSQANLLKNCDGDLGRSACPGRSVAIKAGAKLPVTLKEQQAKETQATSVRVGGVVKPIGKGLVSRIREEIWVVGEQRPRVTSVVAVAKVIMVDGVFPIVWAKHLTGQKKSC
jgi:hypothetical protein